MRLAPGHFKTVWVSRRFYVDSWIDGRAFIIVGVRSNLLDLNPDACIAVLAYRTDRTSSDWDFVAINRTRRHNA